MIYISLQGHNYEHDIYELVKVFKDDEIIFLKNQVEEKDSYFIFSYYSNKNLACASYVKDSKIVLEKTAKLEDFKGLEKLTNKEVKLIKLSVYKLLKELTGKKMPWGSLTGIRPVKLVHSMAMTGLDQENIYSLLIELFSLARENAEKIIGIAKEQKRIIEKIDPKGYSIYVNIPFCPSKCSYCSFPTVIAKKYKDIVPLYVDRLIEEIKHTKKIIKDLKPTSIYIGGGTPSAIDTGQLKRIIKSLKEEFDLSENIEFTVECGRPDTINEELILMLKEENINRISINPQTMNPKTLERIGRNHTSDQVLEVYKMAKKHGVKIINMDLIIGLPGEGLEDVRYTLKKIKELNPENLTVHTLALKKGSKLTREGKKETERQEYVEMLKESMDFAKENSYKPYYLYRQKHMMSNLENIGYMRDKTTCIYNIISMEEVQTVIAFGMGAVSKFFYKKENRLERLANFKSLEEYLNRFEEVLERKEKQLKLFLNN